MFNDGRWTPDEWKQYFEARRTIARRMTRFIHGKFVRCIQQKVAPQYPEWTARRYEDARNVKSFSKSQ